MNFRNTPDLLDGVLRRCGELTSDIGTSPRRAAALLYLNQIHLTMVTGGNELNIDIDEPWVWARARQPIVIQLNPSITTGTCSLAQGSAVGSFSTAPQVNGSNASLENWMIRPVGFPELYRISSHTAGSTNFYIDAPYPQTTNASLNFSAFQLDYDLVTSIINIDANNDTVDFSEDGLTNLQASIVHGAYTPSALAALVATAMTSASVQLNTYSGSYNSLRRLFTFTSNAARGSIFQLWGAGTNYYRSMWSDLGFDFKNQSGALSYTGLYPLSSIIRLSQPARVYYGSNFFWGMDGGEIGKLDDVAFDKQYPLIDIKMGTPTHFTVIEETRNGTLKVRFNSYLNTTQNMRVEFDHMPQPKDLYDNVASVPLLPRKFSKVLEFGASYYLLVDKEDSRQQSYLGLSQQALNAMQKFNRRELLRSGVDFGAVIARPDLMPDKRRTLRINDYGYAVYY